MNKVDKPTHDEVSKLMELITPGAVTGPLEATDCQKLATLITGLQKAYYELCDTCKPVEINPTGPAVCSPGQFLPKPGTIE